MKKALKDVRSKLEEENLFRASTFKVAKSNMAFFLVLDSVNFVRPHLHSEMNARRILSFRENLEISMKACTQEERFKVFLFIHVTGKFFENACVKRDKPPLLLSYNNVSCKLSF